MAQANGVRGASSIRTRLVRAVLAPVRRRLRSVLRLGRPAVSIVMPVYDVERYLPACLDSILAQDFDDWELIAVDDGSTDRSPRILADYAARDRRIRVLHQPNSGQGPARNRAIAEARGEFLVFVDSDDLVPPGSLRYLVSRLRRSGSDFAVAGVRRFGGERTYRPSWTVVVHEHDRVGITIDDFPAAMADVVAHHRILRRSFWNERIGGFPSGVYEDHEPMVAAYLRARRFDLLSRVVYEWRLREEGTSTGQQKHAIENLRQRIAVKARAREMVWAEASEPVRAAWVGRVLGIDFPPYVERALEADETYRRELADALRTYLELATPEALAYVRVRQKVRTSLASRGAWDALAEAEATFERLGSIPPTMVRDGAVVLAEAPLAEGNLLPSHLLALSRSECRLQVCLSACEAMGPDRLRIGGWAVIRAVDLADRTPRLRLWLEEATGEEIELSVAAVERPEATGWVNWPHGRFDRGGFEAEIDLGELAGHGIDRDWRLRAHLEVDGLVRDGGVHHALAGSSASRAALTDRRIEVGSAVVQPGFDPEHGFTLRVRPRGHRGRG